MRDEEALAVCERVLEAAGADAEADLDLCAEALLRLANNEPIEHQSAATVSLRLRLRDGAKYGEATVHGLESGDMATLVRLAREQMDALPPEDDPLPSVSRMPTLAVTAWHDDATPEAFDAERRASAAADLVAASQRAGLNAAGICSAARRLAAKATTNGQRCCRRSTWVECDVTAMGDDSSGWAQYGSHAAAGLDAAAMGEAAADWALRGRDPQTLEPGAYRVVLAPAAVATLLRYVASGFNARSVSEGRSWLAGKVGNRVAGESVSLRQDVCHPDLQAFPFDGDGVAVKRLELIRDGIAVGLAHDRRTAAESGAEPTGFSGGGRGAYGAWPSALVMDGADHDMDDLLAACGDGVYVTRLWYTNWVDPRECSITGMTRDGTFRIRDGRLAEPVRNLRINQNLLDLLSGVELLGRAVPTDGVVAPALAAKAFCFHSGTAF